MSPDIVMAVLVYSIIAICFLFLLLSAKMYGCFDKKEKTEQEIIQDYLKHNPPASLSFPGYVKDGFIFVFGEKTEYGIKVRAYSTKTKKREHLEDYFIEQK